MKKCALLTTVSLGISLWLALPGGVHAQTHTAGPCRGCQVSLPSSYSSAAAAPLVVALHGDEGSSDGIFRALSGHTEAAGMILAALECPRASGCSGGSWWRWYEGSRHDPTWVDRQVDALEAAYAVDPRRVYLVGWSGGATYMGWLGPERSDRFAALGYLAGGLPYRRACASCQVPAYFLIGDGDFLLSRAESHRDHLEGCGHPVSWNLLPGVGHSAIGGVVRGARGRELIDWLGRGTHPCLGPGPSRGDAGMAAGDAGVAMRDAGPSVGDAGAGNGDAGPSSMTGDAGDPVAPGPRPPDSGPAARGPDSGGAAADSGPGSPPMPADTGSISGGCSAATDGGGLAWVAIWLLWFLPRLRRVPV